MTRAEPRCVSPSASARLACHPGGLVGGRSPEMSTLPRMRALRLLDQVREHGRGVNFNARTKEM